MLCYHLFYTHIFIYIFVLTSICNFANYCDDLHLLMWYLLMTSLACTLPDIWELWCQKQVSQTRISFCIPQKTHTTAKNGSRREFHPCKIMLHISDISWEAWLAKRLLRWVFGKYQTSPWRGAAKGTQVESIFILLPWSGYKPIHVQICMWDHKPPPKPTKHPDRKSGCSCISVNCNPNMLPTSLATFLTPLKHSQSPKESCLILLSKISGLPE